MIEFRKRQKFLSFVLIFVMMFSMLTGMAVYGEGTSEKSVSIRIEGINKTIINEKDYRTEKNTVYEAVYELLSEKDIPMLVSDSEYGKYISSIDDDAAGNFGGYDGWMYLVNGSSPSDSIDSCNIKDGDEIILYYGGYDPQTLIPKVELSQEKVETGDDFTITISSTYFDWDKNENVTSTIDDVKIEFDGKTYHSNKDGKATLVAPFNPGKYELKISKVREDGYPLIVRDTIYITVIEDLTLDANKHLTKSLNYIYGGLQNPVYGSEWNIMALARGNQNVSKSYYEGYCDSIVQKLIEKDGNLGGYAEYSKLILALTAIGKDITDVGGYNLLEKLADYNKVTSQGVIGASYALLALDSHDYEIPLMAGLDKQATKKDFISFILDKEIKKGTAEAGGWALSGTIPDVDITANVLQALAPYYNVNGDVQAAIDRAIIWLSTVQTDIGGFPKSQWAPASSESISQVIIALTGLEINIDEEGRFIKNNNSLIDALLTFAVPEGGFRHVAGETKVNAMATTQGTSALVAYERFINGQKSFYDMTDVVINKNDSGNGGGNENENGNGGSSGTGGNGGSSGSSGNTKKYVTLSIDKLTIDEGQVIKPTTVELKANDTVWALTKREMDKRDIDYDYSGSDVIYVKSIDGVGEFDYGPTSGWMYSVNGNFSEKGANQYKLKDGDKVKWHYSTNLGKDLGDNYSQSKPSAGKTNTGDGGKSAAATGAPMSTENQDVLTDASEKIIPKKEIDLEAVFSDSRLVSTWAEDAIIRATAEGFVAGNNGYLEPKKDITRGEFVKVIISALGLDISGNSEMSFSDVTEDDWFYPYVNAAYKANIIMGSDNRFNPGDSISREQMAALVVRALNLKPGKLDYEIQDIAEVSSWAKSHVETVAAYGIMTGNDGIFSPKAPVTKEMAIVVVMRVYDYMKNSGGTTLSLSL